MIQLPIRCAKLKSELINIELKNHTIGKQMEKLQAGLNASVSVVEQTRIRKNISILEGQRENNERLLVNEKKRLLEAEHELETLQKELFDLENFSV